MAYLLNIRTMSMRLDSKDWKVISKVMLTIISESFNNKMADNQVTTCLLKNIGELTIEEQILVRMLKWVLWNKIIENEYLFIYCETYLLW